MDRIVHNLVPNTPEWDAHRAACFNASDAAAMLDMSPYKSRAQFVRECALGITQPVSAEMQRRFDDGHRFEELARPLAEKITGEELLKPIISIKVDGIGRRLSASMDGLDIADTVGWEHKTLNKELTESLPAGVIPEQYHPQLEQQLLVSGASRILFMASRGDHKTAVYDWYESNPHLRARILAGWPQFEKDVAAYVHEESAPVPVAAPVMDLPAVNVNIEGALQVLSNLPEFGTRLRNFIDGLNPAPETDQDFADAENEVKVLKRAEDELQAAEDRALSQISVVDEMRKTKAMLHKLARDTRLAREKLVKDRKEFVRAKIQSDAVAQIQAHIRTIDAKLGNYYLPAIPHDIAGAMKGKKTISSLKDAASTAVAQWKIQADGVAETIARNLDTLDARHEFAFLFRDKLTLVLKDPEAVAAIVQQRIDQHENEQRAKAEAAAEAAREKIRREEQAKAEAEARARADAERREREKAEAARRAAERQESEIAARAEAARREAELEAAALSEAPPAPAPSAVVEVARVEIAPKARPRPTDAQIALAVARHFNADAETVIGWLRDMHPAALTMMDIRKAEAA